MTPGNNGASTPEDDDPFGYLYADGQAAGAQPPSGGGGYGYPGSVNRVRPVGERQYGQSAAQSAPTAQYGQVPQQQATYGRPAANHVTSENFSGGVSTPHQHAQHGGRGGGRGRGPNTRGLLIGAVAVVAAVVIGIGIAMLGGDSDDDKNTGDAAGPTASAGQSAEPSETSTKKAEDAVELPKIDAKALKLGAGVTAASDVKGAKGAGGVYVAGFNQVGASVSWTVNDIPKSGKYTLYVNYGVPGKDANATLTINGEAQNRPLNLANFAKAAEGAYEKGWTQTWANIQLSKGTNVVKLSCETGNQCDVNLDQLWLESGWK
ncbi:carbohydrate-binding protein [Streptomyces sp. NPDC006285]|uniref:carbohydrate-binding protein n=1 Tax=Streptomyces sp. NPDC006285 TaxID=3364742 RepID=UPI00368E9C38